MIFPRKIFKGADKKFYRIVRRCHNDCVFYGSSCKYEYFMICSRSRSIFKRYDNN